MKFVDYKCLESLLIEGEEMIATEGIGSAISGIAKRIFGMISRFINTIIGIFRGLINKLRGKKPKKFTSEELKKMGIDTFEPDTVKPDKIKVDTIKPESNKPNINKIILSSDIFYCLNCINIITSNAICGISNISNNKSSYLSYNANKDIDKSELDKFEDRIDKYYPKIEDIISKYDNSQCCMRSKDKDKIIKGINESINKLEEAKNDLDDITRTIAVYEVLQKNANANKYINHVTKAIPKLENYATKLTTIINNCEISE